MERIGRQPDAHMSVSVQARIRRQRGSTSGSQIERCGIEDEAIAQPSSKYTSRDIHEAVFPVRPERQRLADYDEGIRIRVRRLYARGRCQTRWTG